MFTTADQMDSSMGVYSPVPAVQSWVIQPIRWTPAWVSTVQSLLFRAGSYSRSDGLQHGCLQSSFCCSELGHTADQMDSSMGVYSPVSAVQSWVIQPIRWTPAWVSTVQFLLFRAGSYSRSDGLQHGCLQSSFCCSELGHTADQMDSSMGVYSPVSAVQSWVIQPIRWTPAWVSTVQFLLFRAGSYSRSDGLQHGCLQSSFCCSELGHTADQMDSSMGVYSPVSAVQSWVTSSECTEPQHMHFLRRRMNYISGWLSYPDFKRPLAPVAFAVVSSRGAARGDRRKRHKHTNLWWIH